MTDPAETPFHVGDAVRVVGHHEWHHRQTHGLVGVVVKIWPADPALGDDDGGPLYDVDLPGFDVAVPLAADEIVRVAEPAG